MTSIDESVPPEPTPLANRRPGSALAALYFLLNGVCAFVVLGAYWYAGELARREQRDHDAVDAVSVFLVAAPALLLAILLNIAWLAKSLLDISRRQRYLAVYALAAGVLVWLLTIVGVWLVA